MRRKGTKEIWLIVTIIIISSFIAFASTRELRNDFFGEELLIRPLPDGNVLGHLQFTNSYYVNKSQDASHFSLFPKPLAQIINKFGVENLELTFTQGRWNGEVWGVPILDAPHGVQLIASFFDEKDLEVNWKRLVNSLAGLFCSSLNALDETTTAIPSLSFQYFQSDYKQQLEAKEFQDGIRKEWTQKYEDEAKQQGVTIAEYLSQKGMIYDENTPKVRANIQRNRGKKSNIKYAAMPNEAVCTENLTPWMKLLPCRDQSGLGKLLNPVHLYDSLFHSMGTIVRSFPDPENNEILKIELSQTLSIVFSTYKQNEYTIASLFGASSLESCRLSTISNAYVQIDTENTVLLDPLPTQYTNTLATYPLSSSSFNFKIKKLENRFEDTIHHNDIIAHRYLLGYGDERGGVVTQIMNTNPTETLHIYYFDYLPWFLPVYYHKLKIIIDGTVVPIFGIDEWRMEPAVDHGRPSILELGLDIPPSTTTTIMYYFEKSFLIWTEHPPDAHRGFDVVSACITTVYKDKPQKMQFTGLEWSPVLYANQTQDDLYHHRAYTEGLLVLAPTPDFSMPYNVITLTCTMFTLVFSSTINVITRRFDYLKKGGEYSTGRLSLVLYRKLRNYFMKA